ncbi:hypothetical protein N4R57_03605 [Rhodobacteraceae bacterium D3-12]|nr:hypothetical protein N4R57_03605 [Rhodobacteraceae bacterium D3-12]
MTQQPDYKTLPGGSIDYAHYIRRSHDIRSRSAHGGLRRIWQSLKSLGVAIVGVPGPARPKHTPTAPRPVLRANTIR